MHAFDIKDKGFFLNMQCSVPYFNLHCFKDNILFFSWLLAACGLPGRGARSWIENSGKGAGFYSIVLRTGLKKSAINGMNRGFKGEGKHRSWVLMGGGGLKIRLKIIP